MRVKNLVRMGCLLFVGVPLVLPLPVWAQSAPSECGRSPIDFADEAGLTLAEKIRRMDRALTRSLNRYDECEEAKDDKRETDIKDPAEQAAESESGNDTDSENPAGGREAADAESGESASASPGDISGDAADPASGPAPAVSSLPSLALPPPGTEGSTNGQAGSSQGGVEGEGDGVSAAAGPSSTAAGDIAGDEPEQQARTSGAGRQQDPERSRQAGGPGDGTVAGTGTPVLNNGKLPEDIPPSENDSVLEGQIRQAAIDEPDPELKKKLWNEYRRYKGLPQVK
jgi:hypothetical protein